MKHLILLVLGCLLLVGCGEIDSVAITPYPYHYYNRPNPYFYNPYWISPPSVVIRRDIVRPQPHPQIDMRGGRGFNGRR